jgi:outer membrane protein assembly factor BamB
VVYIANGQDPEHGEGTGHAVCDRRDQARRHHRDGPHLALHRHPPLDLDGRGEGRHRLLWPDFSGFVHAIDIEDRQAQIWKHDMFAAMWGSPMIIDDKVYIGDEDGDVAILQHGKELTVLAEHNMGSSVYATPVPANGALFVMNRNQLYALAEGAMLKPATAGGR